ncbi:MAG: 2-oxoacid:acceptor oxidoreductase family protein [Desulfurococcaceae archaeon TW002]
MKVEMLIVGRGGQGILLLGRVIGVAASKYAGLYVTSVEAYASETRGGESRVDLVMSDNPEEIDYVRVLSADIALFMYPYNLTKYSEILKKDAYVFINSTFGKEHPFKTQKVFLKPYSEIAEKNLGSSRVANMVALGHLIAKTGVQEIEHVEKALREIISENMYEINIKALKVGFTLD